MRVPLFVHENGCKTMKYLLPKTNKQKTNRLLCKEIGFLKDIRENSISLLVGTQ